MAGAFCGAVVTWAAFRMHFEATENADRKLGVFSTSPAIRHTFSNFLTELIGTFVLAFGALAASAPTSSLGALDALPVALLVAGIGMGLGGPTGYAINPARDLGTAHCPLRAADFGQARQRLVLQLDPCALGPSLAPCWVWVSTAFFNSEVRTRCERALAGLIARSENRFLMLFREVVGHPEREGSPQIEALKIVLLSL